MYCLLIETIHQYSEQLGLNNTCTRYIKYEQRLDITFSTSWESLVGYDEINFASKLARVDIGVGKWF